MPAASLVGIGLFPMNKKFSNVFVIVFLQTEVCSND